MSRFKNMGEWRVQEPEAASPTRRTRRGTPDAGLSLFRERDRVTLSVGDCVVVESELVLDRRHEQYTGVVTKLAMGLLCRVELWVLPMLAKVPSAPEDGADAPETEAETPETEAEAPGTEAAAPETEAAAPGTEAETVAEATSGELLLVSKNVRVEISKIAAKTRVEDSGPGPFCCRAADATLDRISAPFAFSQWIASLKQNSDQALFSIAEKTLEIISPRKRASDPPRRSPSKPKASEKAVVETVYESDSESEYESEEETPKKRRRESGTPQRRNRTSAKKSDVFQQVVSVLSPVNKGFKIKSGSVLSSLPSFKSTFSEPSAFKELKEKLHTSTRVDQLPCREEQFEELYMNLESAIMEKMGTCFYVSGTPGVGKTATIREVVAALRDNVQSGYVDEFDFLEINSLKLLTPNSAYEKLWDHLTGIKVTPSNAALLLEEYFSRGKDIKRPLIILMDELDQLVTKNQKVIYNFFNWPTYAHSKLIVIAVANTMDLPERVFSNKIASRLGLRRMAFRGYTEEELGTIIEHRLKMLSEENKRIVEITPDAMRFALKKVAIVSGDARRALTICRRAVEMAEKEYLDTENTAAIPEKEQKYGVRIGHIGMAIAETVNSPTARVLQALPFASKLFLVGVLLRIRRSGAGENPLGEVMDEMKNTLLLETRVEALEALLYGGNVRVQHIKYVVQELVDQGILTQQNARSERFRGIGLNLSEDEVTAVLRRDCEVGHMV